MLSSEDWMNIKLLSRQGHSIRGISKITGLSRNTVRKSLRQPAPQPFNKPKRSSKLDHFKPYIERRYNECALSAPRLLDELRPMGYKGSVDLIRRFIRSLPSYSGSAQKLTVRFETPPGLQAQVDWTYCGKFPNKDGLLIPVYAFVMVLSFSRYLYIEFTSSMKIETFIACHIRAFDFLGGWPQTILYDNMKQVRTNQKEFNPLFLDFANHYGFVPKTHKPYRPRTKGKVERSVDYLKENFLNGRLFLDLADLNSQGLNWLNETANLRLHSTTQRRPVDLLELEKLTPVGSITPYQLTTRVSRKVSWEGFVNYRKSRYSVPPEQAGREVIVEEGSQRIIIRSADSIVAEHALAQKAGQTVTAQEHIEEMWKLSVGRSAPPEKHWEVSFQQAVDVPPLSWYEEEVK